MPKPHEYFLFRNYSIGIRNWLRRNIYLSSYPDNENVIVAHQTPERAWANWIYPVVNGAMSAPYVIFSLNNLEYKQNENLLGFVREYKPLQENKFLQLRPPLVYQLTYSVTIYTRLQSEMDVILYQILSKTSKNAKDYIFVDKQWAEITTSDPRPETNLEPGEAQEKIHRYGIDFIIPRAYLPLDYREIHKILETDVDIDAIDNLDE